MCEGGADFRGGAQITDEVQHLECDLSSLRKQSAVSRKTRQQLLWRKFVKLTVSRRPRAGNPQSNRPHVTFRLYYRAETLTLVSALVQSINERIPQKPGQEAASTLGSFEQESVKFRCLT